MLWQCDISLFVLQFFSCVGCPLRKLNEYEFLIFATHTHTRTHKHKHAQTTQTYIYTQHTQTIHTHTYTTRARAHTYTHTHTHTGWLTRKHQSILQFNISKVFVN